MSNSNFNPSTSAPLNPRLDAVPVAGSQAKSEANSSAKNDNAPWAVGGEICGIHERGARAGGARGLGNHILGAAGALVLGCPDAAADAVLDAINANKDNVNKDNVNKDNIANKNKQTDTSSNDNNNNDEDSNIATQFAPCYPCEADIRLVICDRSGEVRGYDVQKEPMEDASLVWRDIFAQFAAQMPVKKEKARKSEEDQEPPPVLDLTQVKQPYDAAGFEVVLWLMHGLFSKVERAPAMKLLYNVAQVVEMYQCWGVLASHLKDWLIHLDRYICAHHDSVDDEKLLFINWVFGDAHLFLGVLFRAAHKATIDQNGNLRDSRGRLWSLNPDLPRPIIDSIPQLRLVTIERILGTITQVVSYLESHKNSSGHCHVYDNKKNPFISKTIAAEYSHLCLQIQLDSLLAGLDAVEVGYPTPASRASEYHESVNTFANKILDIKIARLHIPDGPEFLGCHVGCGQYLRGCIVRIMKQNHLILPQEIKEKMDERRLRSEACPGLSGLVRGCRCALGHGF
ncbi:uncharacterized protein C8A04DRAFT_26637 [Dichotomopilus funicola]|uniref:Uncharacterized protein n=1 Tax=Dichotomopilus funicola TaxID=1934379 RepID=A0AAN6V6E8_9PEZI|nr:hypothetical protein C8A04DRAFT_26637 [Dichotomopilus funicola]